MRERLGKPLFAYGALVFPGVIGAVLGREPWVTPANVRDFAAMRIPEMSYPGLVAAPRKAAHGSLVMGLSVEEWIALDEYEDGFYRCVPLEVIRS